MLNALKEAICSFLQMSMIENHGKNLGLPSLVDKNRKVIFSFIKDKVWQRIQSWKRRMLSKEGDAFSTINSFLCHECFLITTKLMC